MSRENKKKEIEVLSKLLAECSAAVFTDYRGLSNSEMTDMRAKLREREVSYRVVKNTLARLAAREAGLEYLEGIFNGPVAMAFGYGEVNKPAKAILEYIKASKLEIEITAGYADDRLLSASEVMALSKIPPKDVLLASVLVAMKGPIYGLVNSLSNPMRGLVGILNARVKQLEGG